MASKITFIRKTDKVRPAFTCPYCGSNTYSPVSGEGRVAGKHEKKYVCLKCKKVVSIS